MKLFLAFAFVIALQAQDPSLCADHTVAIPASLNGAWNGWSPSSNNSRFQPVEVAGLTLEQVRRLKLKWAFGFEGDTIVYSLPSVIGNNVFVGSNSGKVHALDARTGCTQWMFQAADGVRTAIVLSGKALLFGDRGGSFYSLDAESGRLLWKKKLDDHPAARLTGAAVVNDGIAYVPVASTKKRQPAANNTPAARFAAAWSRCVSATARNFGRHTRSSKRRGRSAVAHPAWKSGALLARVCGPRPTLDLERSLLYVNTGDNYSPPATNMSDAAVALDLKTGRIVWSRPNDPG